MRSTICSPNASRYDALMASALAGDDARPPMPSPVRAELPPKATTPATTGTSRVATDHDQRRSTAPVASPAATTRSADQKYHRSSMPTAASMTPTTSRVRASAHAVATRTGPFRRFRARAASRASASQELVVVAQPAAASEPVSGAVAVSGAGPALERSTEADVAEARPRRLNSAMITKTTTSMGTNRCGAHQLNAAVHSATTATAVTSQAGRRRRRRPRMNRSTGAWAVPCSGMATQARK